MTAKYSILSDAKILEYCKAGKIVIEPYNIKNLNTSSYDVTIGPNFYKEQAREAWISPIYNMYSESDVNRVWGEPLKAKPAEYYRSHGYSLDNIRDDELVIFIEPGETILAHTNEFIGGVDSVTTMMKSRSSLGRNFISVCKCAGWGDCGYFTRWTMEITNNSNKYRIPLVVGRRIAQIIFMETDGPINKKYNEIGKYQTSSTIEELQELWTPSMMLPKMYNDWEILGN